VLIDYPSPIEQNMPSTKYKNAPIVEALCELQFNLPDSPSSHMLTMIGKMQGALGGEYSGAPREQRMRNVTLGADISAVEQTDTLFRVHLPSADNKRLIGLGTDALTINILPPYLSWEDDFRPRIMAALDAYWSIANPLSVKRVGIRYINRIVVPETPTDFTKWFTSPGLTAKVARAKLTHFVHADESKLDDGTKIIVNHLTTASELSNTTTFILDIDTAWDESVIDRREAIDVKIDALHAIVGDVFEALIRPATSELFND
jgi:uncharacterized protein (TIGR04255 family)